MASASPPPRASAASPEPELLTPRSKVKALLATVDSSDDDHDSFVSRRQPSVTGPRPDPESDEESDESDVPVRPRGRLAARMRDAVPEEADTRDALRHRRSEPTPSPARQGADADRDRHDDLPMPRRLSRRSPAPGAHQDPEQPDGEHGSEPPVASPSRPSPAKSSAMADSDSDQELPALKSNRFQALLERKRQQRLAREASEEAREAEQRAHMDKIASESGQLDSDDGADSGITDDEGGRTLTQKARPTRKASKKAVEEMNRETQRMARNMQLAHEAKTRKRISKASLFERFNFRPVGAPLPEPVAQSSSRPTTPPSDPEIQDKDTPPSSPPAAKEQLPKLWANDKADEHGAADDELPSLDQVISLAIQSLPKDKGKGKEVDVPETSRGKKPGRRVRVRLPPSALDASRLDNDDELEVKCTTKDKLDAVFNKIPAQGDKESRSLRNLRALALVKSPGKQGRQKQVRPGITAAELHAQLYQKARQQARLERDRRLEMLKAQGVVIQTADERERQEQEVEDLVAKAREEAQQIMEQERAAAKKERDESGNDDPLAWDDSEDDEYAEAPEEAEGEASAIEFSGSDSDSEQEQDDEDESDRNEEAANPLFDENAEVDGSEVEPDQDEVEEHGELPAAKQRRARKHAVVLSDDEAEVEATPRPKPKPAQTSLAEARIMSPAAPPSVLRSAKKLFIPGLPVQGPAGLGLTQIFAGTMDDSQVGGPTQSLMPDFDHFPDSNFSATAEAPAEDMILDTQRDTLPATQDSHGVCLNLSQSQMRGLDSLLLDRSQTPMSPFMEPSQDAGLQDHTPLKERFIEPPVSTVETIPADQHGGDLVHDSPLARRGRLRRKMDVVAAEDEKIEATQVDAFKSLAEGAKKRKRAADDFDRKRTKAKDMVEDQADESEDEYAGLGGADGEESDDESTGSVDEMIDDAHGNVDEGELAAFYADRERANDEMEVERLFKDITTGMLRRKRGADYDLSDSDDGGEARRRMKRRQFAKMQKALFADERVKKMAENPGNQAFLRTMEDRESDDETDLLGMADAPDEADTQPQSQQEDGGEDRPGPKTIPDSQPGKQPLRASAQGRPPAHMRRTAGGKKPSNLGQVRETLSDLLEKPRHGSVIPATEAGSDSDDDDGGDDEADGGAASRRGGNKENRAPSAPRRGTAVVDRISLKRATSSTLSGRLAFTATASASSSFRVPALLRRATTNSTRLSGTASSSSAASAANPGAGGFGGDARIKQTAGRQSGVVVTRGGDARPDPAQAGERRREQRRARDAVSRVGVVSGLLGRGCFE